MSYNIYSLADTRVVLYHPYVGTAILSLCGIGKIVVSYAGDLSSHTATADGTVVVNRLKTQNATVTVEIPQNSIGDQFMRKWIKYLRNAKSEKYLLTTLTITDPSGGPTITMTGVTPQKTPDRTYDRTSSNLTYTLLAAEVTEQ